MTSHEPERHAPNRTGRAGRTGHDVGAGDAVGAWIRAALDTHERSLVAYAARLTGNVESGRDVVQETFLRLVREERSEVEPRLKAWLFAVCRNRALDVRAKERPMHALSSLSSNEREPVREPVDPTPDPATRAVDAESAGAALRLVRELPDDLREVVELKFQHGLSYREIAGVTEHPIGQVSWLIHRAMKTLRERMASERRVEKAEGLA